MGNSAPKVCCAEKSRGMARESVPSTNCRGAVHGRSRVSGGKCEENVKIFPSGKHVIGENTAGNDRTVRTDSAFTLRGHCLREMFQTEPHFLRPGVMATPSVLLVRGLNQSFLQVLAFWQQSEPSAKTAHLIPCTIRVRRQ